jgi:hypothetical protein
MMPAVAGKGRGPDREAHGRMAAAQTAAPSPARRASPLGWALRGALAGLALAVGGEAVYTFVGDNFRTVVPGAVYRSSRLPQGRLEHYLRKYHIRTVVNLTGCCDPLPEYLAECRANARLDASQEDLGFSACRLPPVPEVRRLVEVLDRCEYPILIHCHKGIDRTGLGCAFALLLHTDAPLDDALAQLGPRFGHLPVGRTGNIDRFFDLYKEWLAENRLAHSAAAFRRFAVEAYCPGECRAAYRVLGVGDGPVRARQGEPAAVRVRCTNTSVKPWRMQPERNAGVHLGWMVETAEGDPVYEGRSGLFERVVPPGESVEVTVPLPTTLTPGRYRLRLDMIDEQHAWFYQEGASQPLYADVEVR